MAAHRIPNNPTPAFAALFHLYALIAGAAGIVDTTVDTLVCI